MVVVPEGAENEKNDAQEGAEGESIVVMPEQGADYKTIVVPEGAEGE